MSVAQPPLAAVMWHDVECGRYVADLPLWRELAQAAAPARVLDIGAGTGRVALDLARAGHAVTALDIDPVLLAELRARASRARLDVETVTADATAFDLGPVRFSLALVPMQTVQLLSDAAARSGLVACAARHLAPGGRLAIAIAEELEPFGPEPRLWPDADVGERAGWRYSSQPVAIRAAGDAMVLERLRSWTAPDGSSGATGDVVRLALVSCAELEAAGRAAGLAPEARRSIPATSEHVGSAVVVLRG